MNGKVTNPLELAMNEAETKTCPMCAETIKAAAKVCPRCGRNQPATAKDSWRRMIEVWLLMAAFAAIVFGGLYWLQRIVEPGQSFERFRDKVAVIDSHMHFSSSNAGNFISTIGLIRNDSVVTWRSVQVEVRYLDAQGRLVDTKTETLAGRLMPTGEPQAFRIRAPADKPASAYVNQTILVRSAVDARALR